MCEDFVETTLSLLPVGGSDTEQSPPKEASVHQCLASGLGGSVLRHGSERTLEPSMALKQFLLYLEGKHVMVSSDKTMIVGYINHQGGLRSKPFRVGAVELLLWAQT